MTVKYTLNELPQAAHVLLDAIGSRRHIAFYGTMGAGKTTLIKEICHRLGVNPDEVNSPTFAIVNEYDTTTDTIYHFDFYRINSPAEALDFGLYDYLDSGCLCLMEWPEQITPLLPDDTVAVRIETIDDTTRRLTVD